MIKKKLNKLEAKDKLQIRWLFIKDVFKDKKTTFENQLDNSYKLVTNKFDLDMHTNQYRYICFTLKDNAKTIREINCGFSLTRTKRISIYDATTETIIFNKESSLNTYQNFINSCSLAAAALKYIYNINFMSDISFACLRKVYPVDSLSEDNTTDIKIDPNLAEELEKAGFSDFIKRESIVFEFLGFNGLPTGAYISTVNSDNTMTKTDNKETVRIKFSVLTSGYSIKTVELSDLGGLTQSIEICDEDGNWKPDIITDIVPKVEFRKIN